MGTRYVIAVMRVEEVEGSANQYDTRDTTLFEATHTDPARLARFAAEEVVAVLAEAAGIELNMPIVGLLPRPAWASGDRFTVPAAFEADGAVPEEMSPEEVAAAGEAFSDTTPAKLQDDASTPEAEKPKRIRRTKAQIAADKEAQAIGYRDAAHRAEAQALGVAGEQEAAGPAEVFGLPLQPAALETVIVDPFAGAAAVPASAPAALVPDPYPSDNYNPAPAAAPAKFDPFG